MDSKGTEARIRQLPPTAAIALAARGALRVLPAFAQAVDDKAAAMPTVRTGTIAGLLALRAAVTGSPETPVAERAADMLAKAGVSGVGESAKQCLIATARAVAAPEADLWWASALPSVLAGHAKTAEVHGVLAEFEAALGADLEQLEELRSKRGPHLVQIPYEYFGRPLFAPATNIPEKWQPLVKEWAERAAAQYARQDHELYLRMCQGGTIDRNSLDQLVDAWKKPVSESPSAPVSSEPSEPPSPLAEGQPSSRPDVWMLSDRPLEDKFGEQDRFQFKDYADALAAILDHEKTDTPFTMAINAPWGAGKTTLANMIAAQLKQRPEDRGQAAHIICHFNAWMHDDAPNVATAFVSQVSRKANEHRTWIHRTFQPLPWAVLEPNVRRKRRLLAGTAVVALTLLASWWIGQHLQHLEEVAKYEATRSTTYQHTETVARDASGKEASRTESQTFSRLRDATPPPNAPVSDAVDPYFKRVQSHVVALGAFFTAIAGLTGLLVKALTSTAIGGFVQSPEKAAESGAIPATQRHLGRLIKQATWRGNRFVVFIDDIERCKPPRSIDVLDAVNQLMDHPGVLVVLLGDMSAVAAAAQLKYKDLARIYVPSAGIMLTGADRGKEAFGRLYLQKIVQFQFDLPIPPKDKIRDYMGQLAITPEVQGGARVQPTT